MKTLCSVLFLFIPKLFLKPVLRNISGKMLGVQGLKSAKIYTFEENFFELKYTCSLFSGAETLRSNRHAQLYIAERLRKRNSGVNVEKKVTDGIVRNPCFSSPLDTLSKTSFGCTVQSLPSIGSSTMKEQQRSNMNPIQFISFFLPIISSLSFV